jgi:hypothetical protein
MNNRITEYSARYQYQIFGVGQIVGLQRIIGVFFYRILDILAENQMLQLLDGKNRFLLVCLLKMPKNQPLAAILSGFRAFSFISDYFAQI